ncbi:MAG: hypothetical protein V4450_17390 [Bacteroidota bacterium]
MASSKKKVKIEHPCAQCKEEIPDWRSNKKFCKEECKNKFFNEVRKQEAMEMGRVNRILKKNYEILKRIIKDEPNQRIKLQSLTDKGFDIKFLTHLVNGYHNCYNLSWRTVENGNVIISRPSETPEAEKLGFTKLLKPGGRE